MNSNITTTLNQIENTLEVLRLEGIIEFTLPYKYIKSGETNNEQITWTNHQRGRNLSSRYFNNIDQYMSVLCNGAYHALFCDYSILRYSFVFDKNKLVSQNLLWWPCPVNVDKELADEFGVIDAINLTLEDKGLVSKLRMRSPIRFDFDINNNTFDHPRAHFHMQHPENRINTREPICFNTFVKFILENNYPHLNYEFKEWDDFSYQYDDKNFLCPYKRSIYISI